MNPPVPENEADRLRTLRLYQILDTATEKTLDDLTGLAATICETSISLISLVDKNRQWFKSRVGLNVTETPRDVAFCAHSIMGDDILIVEDATKDERFAQNPLVTAEPYIRFYAGAPLVVAKGISLGTLCVIDREPRQLTAYQINALKILRQAVVAQIELRRMQKELLALEYFLPMCAWCRSIRGDDGTWRSPQDFIIESVPITHGICPNCSGGLNSELNSRKS